MTINSVIIAIVLLSFALNGRAATWYVNPNAPTLGNGTSWTNAWRQPGDIIWANVNPGDTIELAFGAHTNRGIVGKSGTQEAPIVIKRTRDPAYAGLVHTVGGVEARWSLGDHDWITFDGRISDTPASLYASQTTNNWVNCGWVLQQTNINQAAFITSGTGTNVGLKFYGLQITGSANPDLSDMQPNDAPGNTAIGFGNASVRESEIAWCDIGFMGQDGIGGNNAGGTVGDVWIHHNYIHDLGDDGIEMTHGVIISDNIVVRTRGLNGHPDCIVIVGRGEAWVLRNILGGFNTYAGPFIGIQYNLAGNIRIENNLVWRHWTNSGDGSSAVTVDQTLKETGPQFWQNIVVANNTTIGLDPAFSFYNRYKPSAGNTNPGYSFRVTISNAVYANNLTLDATATAVSLKGWDAEGIDYATNALGQPAIQVRNNIFASTNVNGRRIYFQNGGAPYATAEAFDVATASLPGFGNNTSSRPILIDPDAWNFRPALSDTVAKGAGADLSTLGITNDIETVTRTLPYDIGAFRAQGPTNPPPALMMHLDFEDDFSDGVSDDSSGNGAHMHRFGATNDVNAYWPTRVPSGKHGTYAARFQPQRDVFPFPNNPTFWAGQFGAVTNVTHMQGLPEYTLMVWARFDEWGGSTTEDHNATFFDTGYSGRGGIHFGRYYSTTYGNARFLVNTNEGSIAAAPQYQWPQVSTYSGDVWRHYAVTVSHANPTNALITTYLDGAVVISTNLVLQVANSIDGLDFTDPAGTAYGPWGCVGCWQHGGTPLMTDTDWFPNNGWMNGWLDDLRIYSGVLSQGQIQTIVAEANPDYIPRVVNAGVGNVGTVQ